MKVKNRIKENTVERKLFVLTEMKGVRNAGEVRRKLEKMEKWEPQASAKGNCRRKFMTLVDM